MMYDKSWWFFALLSAVFAALTAIFAKVGVEAVDSTLATAIRTVVILIMAWGIVWAGGQWEGLSTYFAKNAAVFGAVGCGNRTILALLLQGATNGSGFLGSAGR